MTIHRIHNTCMIKNQRIEILQKLILRNLKNETLKVRKLDLSKQGYLVSMNQYLSQESHPKPISKKFSFSKVSNSQPSSQQQQSSHTESTEDRAKISIPFYFFKIKSPDIRFERNTCFDGSEKLTLYSRTPVSHCLFEDFEIIKKLV